MSTNWFDLLSAAGIGGLIVKLLDYFLLLWRKRSEQSRSAKFLLERHLDPILKGADELIGKIYSLAQKDFLDVEKEYSQSDKESNLHSMYLLYLFGQFWSKIQILKLESIYVNLQSQKKGKQLKSFINTLESLKIRIAERAIQRGIGETLIENFEGQLRTISFYDFSKRYNGDKELRKWFYSIKDRFEKINHTRNKQNVLVYGTIILAMIDTLDPDHLTTRNRPTWTNKLTRKSRRVLQNDVFNSFLAFVKNKEKYYVQ